jgi:hypothetical protein
MLVFHLPAIAMLFLLTNLRIHHAAVFAHTAHTTPGLYMARAGNTQSFTEVENAKNQR